MADTLIAMQGKDFLLVACDAAQAFSVISMKDDEDKILPLDRHKVLAMAGEAGDREQFGQYIQKNLKLHTLRSGLPISTHGAANFTRNELATFLRKSPYQVNLLLCGWDMDEGPSIYYMDYLASIHKMKTAAHGYGSYFCCSTMDALFREDMEFDDLLHVMRVCIGEVKKRLVLNSPKFIVKVINKEGVRIVGKDF